MYKILKGIVHKGEQLGRTIGFPTANISDEGLDLQEGTFKLNIIFEEKLYKGIGAHVAKKQCFETHIFDFDQEIYGRELEVIILERQRDKMCFAGLSELKAQIEKDVKKVKSEEDVVLTFGTFDETHEGHRYYLKNAKKYGDTLITIIATDKNVEKIKGFKTHNNQEKRKSDIKNFHICDTVQIGSEDNPMQWIKKFNPKVICLGYDQHGFTDALTDYISQNNLKIEIIRIGSYKEDIYKSSLIKKQLK